ncbi:MAG: hypothetical protein PVF65_05835 [Sphingomonadales bacterium]|jgi:uncharacterized integral membrane protein
MTEPNNEHHIDEKKSIWTPRKIFSLLLAAIVFIFLMQNLAIVEVNFLAWSIRVPRAVLVIIVLLIGIALGLLLNKAPRHKDQ